MRTPFPGLIPRSTRLEDKRARQSNPVISTRCLPEGGQEEPRVRKKSIVKPATRHSAPCCHVTLPCWGLEAKECPLVAPNAVTRKFSSGCGAEVRALNYSGAEVTRQLLLCSGHFSPRPIYFLARVPPSWSWLQPSGVQRGGGSGAGWRDLKRIC